MIQYNNNNDNGHRNAKGTEHLTMMPTQKAINLGPTDLPAKLHSDTLFAHAVELKVGIGS